MITTGIIGYKTCNKRSKKRARFLALAGENLFQFEVNNLNSVNYQFLSEVVVIGTFAIFVAVFAGGEHMVTPHISETTLDTAKKFHISSSLVPLAMYMKYYKNRNTF